MQEVIGANYRLTNVSKASTLSVKIATEAIFGEDRGVGQVGERSLRTPI